MKIEISREELTAVILSRIAAMDPEEAREELWQHYSENVLPQLDDSALAGLFYEKVVVEEITEDEEDDVVEESVSLN